MSTVKGTISEEHKVTNLRTADLFEQAYRLTSQRSLSHEDGKKAELLLKMLELNLPEGRAAVQHLDLALAERKSGLDEQTQQRDFAKWVQYGINRMEADEKQRHQRYWSRDVPEIRAAQGVGTGLAGGFLVPQGFSGEVEVAEKLASPVRGVARVIKSEAGNDMPWPTVDDTANVGELVAENITTVELDVTFGQVSVKTFRYSSKIIRASLEWLLDSLNPESLLARLLGIRIGRAQNPHFTTGSGSGLPQGCVTGSSQGRVGAAGQVATIILDDLVELKHSLDPLYRLNASWMMHDSTAKFISKIKDSTGAPILLPAREPGQPEMLLSYPIQINNDMAAMAASAKSILFGDFSHFLIRDARDLTMVRLTERFGEYGQVAFVMFQRSDSRMLNSSAIKHYQNPAA